LDVGARDGRFLDILVNRGARYVEGIELLPDVAARGVSRGQIVRVADMRCLPDPDGAWDVVTSIHSLEHVPDPVEAISEMVRVLRPGGWLLIVVPREDKPSEEFAHYSAFPSSGTLKKLVKENVDLIYDSHLLRVDSPRNTNPEIALAIRKHP
jgi:SAM-dependent methyltransferase